VSGAFEISMVSAMRCASSADLGYFGIEWLSYGGRAVQALRFLLSNRCELVRLWSCSCKRPAWSLYEDCADTIVTTRNQERPMHAGAVP
jgi:hypothetical protein